MKTVDNKIKQIFRLGQKFGHYYGNGKKINDVIVTKVSDKSCWLNGFRYSWSTVQRYFESEIFRNKLI